MTTDSLIMPVLVVDTKGEATVATAVIEAPVGVRLVSEMSIPVSAESEVQMKMEMIQWEEILKEADTVEDSKIYFIYYFVLSIHLCVFAK